MTQEEIKKKAFEAYPYGPDPINAEFQESIKRDLREGYIKALTEINELPKIPIWVGRDQDNTLRGFTEIPGRARGLATLEGLWYTDSDNFIVLPFDLLPDLKWEDDPIEVELLIRKV